MSLAFSPEASARIDDILGRYPNAQAALIPTLWVAQDQFGHLTEEAMALVAERLDLPTTKVVATATFYTMFNKRPVGRYHVQVCKNISCFLRNSDALYPILRDKAGVGPGETSADGRFTFSEVECLAACGRAPVVQINETYHEWQTPERFAALLDALVAEDAGGPEVSDAPGATPATTPESPKPESPKPESPKPESPKPGATNATPGDTPPPIPGAEEGA